jgi:FAD/FMN-containing dehydrogenase
MRLLALALALALALPAPAQAQLQACLTATGAAVKAQSINAGDFWFVQSRSLRPQVTPAFIVLPTNAGQVQGIVNCARNNGVKVCARSGGHGFTGSAHCTGVMVDLRELRSWDYNTAAQTMTVGTGSTLGELFWYTLEKSGNSRLIGVGLCPSVGVGGYLLGGGHNPYSGLIGLTCEKLQSVNIVLANGNLVTATASNEYSELFWASCGGGGGSFGIATSATLNTADASPFQSNVFFRFAWPRSMAGEILSKFIDYDQDNGDSWVRMEVNQGGPLFAYGVCWKTSSTSDCINRLSKSAFFVQQSRSTSFIAAGTSVQDFQAFIGPSGGWGNFKTTTSKSTFVDRVYLDSGNYAKRVYASSFMGFGDAATKPSVAMLQEFADTCAAVNGPANDDWIVCQFNPWRGAAANNVIAPGKNSFANKRGNKSLFTEYIGQDSTGDLSALKAGEIKIRQISRAALSGIYVSYPEFGFDVKDYSYLYWGQSLQRLAYLKQSIDPNGLFAHPQQVPSGKIACPGTLAVTSPASDKRSISITGYPIGQLALMRSEIQLSSGCSLVSVANGGILGTSGSVHKIEFYDNKPATITISSSNLSACNVVTVTVNSIACSGSSPTPAPAITTAPSGSCTKTAPGERCIGAPGYPAVPWLGGCCTGDCAPDAAKGWGQWCPKVSGPPAPTPAPAITTAPTGSCTKTAPSQRCIGAPGYPAVPWLGGCCIGDCAPNAAKGWGQWCP